MASKDNDQKTAAAAETKKTSVVAEKTDEKLLPLSTLATAAKIPGWELAALSKAAGWAEGKVVTATEFGTALAKFRKRPQGGGKI